MKLAILQYAPKFGKVENNFDRVERLLSGASCDVAILPELFATGYSFKSKGELKGFAEPAFGGETYGFLSELASSLDAAVAGGYPESSDDGIYNSALFVRPGGEAENYRKIHLFDREKLFFEPGNRPFRTFEFRGARLGMMICFDWIFPESYRILALRGADLILHMTNLVLPYCQRAAYAPAVSNRVFIALSNRIGTEDRAGGELTFTGGSIAYSPSGEVLGRLSETETGVLTVNIEPEKAREKMVTERNHVLEDRRTELYELD